MSDVGFTEFAPMNAPDLNQLRTQHYAMVSSGVKDDGKIVGFYYKPLLNAAKSRGEGRPVYDNIVHVKIMEPGDKLSVVDRPAVDSDKQRWPMQYNQFTMGKKQVSEGAPLDLLFPDKPNIVATLNNFNIQTIEQLAALSAHSISTVGMGAQDWVNKAASWIKMSEKGVDHHKFNTAMQAKEDEISALKMQVKQLSDQMQSILMQRQQQTQPQMPPQNYDHQSSLIANTMKEDFSGEVLPPAQFNHGMEVPDLSNETIAAKRRGRPAGSKNKPKET